MDPTVMDELEITEAEAEILRRMSSWDGRYSTSDDSSPSSSSSSSSSYDPITCRTKLDPDMRLHGKLETRKYALARSRARASNRDFEAALAETQLQIMLQPARILEKTIDPAVAGTRDVVRDEDGEVCGVCREEMGRGEEATSTDCNRKFHSLCILKWLEQMRTCPLCRYVMQVRKY